jgi:hypothetical protein
VVILLNLLPPMIPFSVGSHLNGLMFLATLLAGASGLAYGLRTLLGR